MNRISIFFILLCVAFGQTVSGAERPAITVSQSPFQVPVLINKLDNPVLRVRVTVPASVASARLEAIRLSTEGTTSTGDIRAVRVYYYDNDSTVRAMNDVKRPLFGQSTEVDKEIHLKGTQRLHSGDNFLWVSLELDEKTDLDHFVSTRCVSLTIDGNTVEAGAIHQPVRQRVGIAVRQHQQDGVHTSRIPGLARTSKGTLLAIFDARYESGRDLQGHIDIGLHRSTDQGQTWEPLRITLDMGEWGDLPQKFNGVSDACILVDDRSNTIYIAGLWMHGIINEDGRWLEGLNEHSDAWNHQWRNKASQPGFGVRETSQFLMVKSTDDGKSWSAPINLTRMCKRKEWWLLAPAPGNGITLADGTLVFPTQGRDEKGRSFSNITYSKDGGNTWKTSNPAYSGTTECAVVQLSDGRLMLNMRSGRNKGRLGDDNGRAVAVTGDLGHSWTEHPSSFNKLPEPVCMASLFRHTYGDDKSLLFFSNPNSKEFREDMTIKISRDDGDSWATPDQLLLDEGRSRGYSCITSVDDHRIGILYESSQADLVFQRIDVSDFLD